MKKNFQKPELKVFLQEPQEHLLKASGQFTDEAPEEGWDIGGANARDQQTSYDVWNNDGNK
jgi:hypothetical protein